MLRGCPLACSLRAATGSLIPLTPCRSNLCHDRRLASPRSARWIARPGATSVDHAPTSRTTTSPRWPAAAPSRRSCPPPTSRPASPAPTPAARSTPAWTWPSRPTATPARATRPAWPFASRSPSGDMRMTPEEALLAATAGGARAPPRRHRAPGARRARRRRDPRRAVVCASGVQAGRAPRAHDDHRGPGRASTCVIAS
jgi:hypothetical protein